MADETIGRATIQLGADGSKLAPEMAAAVAKAQGTLDRANKQMERAQASTVRAIQGHIDRINATRPTHEMRLLEQAVLKLGGTSKLSAGQLGRVTSEVNRLAAAGAKVPQSLAGIPKSLEGTAKLSASIKSLATGFISVAAVRAVASELSEAANWARDLNKAVAQTGLSRAGLQQLQKSATGLGYDVNSVTDLVTKMQRAVSGLSAEGANKLGLSFERIRSLAPEQQLEELAKQVSRIQDPTDKAAAAMAIFGESGARMIPLLDEIASGAYRMNAVLGDETVDSLARAEQQLTKYGQQWDDLKRTVLAEVLPALEKLDSVISAGGQAALAERLAGRITGTGLAVKPGTFRDFNLPTAADFLDTSPLSLGIETQAQKEAKQKFARREAEAEARQKKAASEILSLERERNSVLASIVKTRDDEAAAMRDLDKLAQGLLDNQLKIEKSRLDAQKETRLREGDFLPSVGGSGLWTRFQDVLDQELENAAEAAEKTAEETRDWSSSLGDLANQLQNLAATTGGVAGKILGLASSIASGLGGALSSLQGIAGAGGGLKGLLGKLAGGAGLVGSAVGLVGGLVGGFKSLFGRGKQREQVTQGREQFIQSFGGLEELQRRAAAAGVSLERLMKAKDSVKGFESAVKEVTTAIEKHEKKIAGLTSAREASESLLDRIGKGGLSEGLSTALQELIGRVQGALAQAGLGLLKTGPLRESEAFTEQEGIAADLAKLIAGMREAGIVDAGSLAAGGAAAKELQTAAAAAATEAGLPATEATKAGFAAIAPVLREQLNAAIQSGRELDANTKALLEEAKANGIEIMADPLVESLAVQRDQLGVLRSIAGKEFGGPSGAVPAAGGFGPMVTPNLGGGLGPLIQTHPGELAMVIPRSRMGPGGLISAASGLYARHELRGGRGRGATTINLNISEDPFASSVGRERLRRHTLKAVRRETSKHLAALVASGRA